jgi:hypothetical protein
MMTCDDNFKFCLTRRRGGGAAEELKRLEGLKGPKGRGSGMQKGRWGALCRLAVVLGVLLGAAASPARAQDSTNQASGMDFKSFEIIAQRNIFDPTRSGRLRSYNTRRRPAAQAFTFCGIGEASLGKQRYAAMFDGYGNPGRQLYVGDVINGFKIVQIPPPAASNSWRATVQMVGPNKQTISLFAGMHMRREDGGAWTASDLPEPDAPELTAATDAMGKTSDSDSDSSPSSSSKPSSKEDEVLKRLRLQREQEDK